MASTADLVTDSVIDLNEHPKNKEKRSFKEKIVYLREMITIEPMLCLYAVASIVCIPAITNLQLEMSCAGNLGYNVTVCKAILGDDRQDDIWHIPSKEVNEIILNMSSWTSPVQSFLPMIYLIFLGSFSDRHKIRKPFLIIPIIGELFACISCILCVIFKESWPVEVEGISQVIVPSFLGGPEIVYMAAFAYISDVSTPEQRIARIAMMQLCLTIGAPFGSLVTALLFPTLGYIGSFIFGFILFASALIYGMIKVKEPRASGEETNMKSLIMDVFNPQHAIETFKVFFKTKGNQRKTIIFLLVIYSIGTFVIVGESSLFTNFANHVYGWNGEDLTYYYTAATVINLIALGIGIPILSGIFEFHDLIIVAIAFSDKIIANIVILLVRNSCGLYMSIVAGILAGIMGVGLNSQLTKSVSEDDVAKIQSLLTIVLVIIKTIAIEVYTHGIWKNIDTKDVKNVNSYFPQGFYIVGVVVFIPTIIALIWKYYRVRNNKSIEVPLDENGTEMNKTET